MSRYQFTIRISTIGAWILLCLSVAFMIISSRVWRVILGDIYGNNWSELVLPTSTVIYLHSTYWGATIPFVAGLLLLIAWMRDRLERSAPFYLFATHALTTLILAYTFYAAICPFLNTLWRMGTP